MAEGGYMVGWQMNKSESTREDKYCSPTPLLCSHFCPLMYMVASIVFI